MKAKRDRRLRIAGPVFSDDPGRRVPAENFCATLNANVDNRRVSDKEFRAFVRRTLPIVQFIEVIPWTQRPQCELERLGMVAYCPCTCLHTTHPVENHADGCPEKKNAKKAS
jgi:hypothetical protein